MAAGGFLSEIGGITRVNGNLNLSRAIGDLRYKMNSEVRCAVCAALRCAVLCCAVLCAILGPALRGAQRGAQPLLRALSRGCIVGGRQPYLYGLPPAVLTLGRQLARQQAAAIQGPTPTRF